MWIVTGTGRSGTSLVCQILHAAGADFGPPDRLQAPDSANPHGYYEQQEFNAINIQLLLGNHVNADILLRPPRSSMERIRAAFQRALYALPASRKRQACRGHHHLDRVGELCSTYHQRFVKDPRFSRTLDFWRAHCTIEGVIFCYRSPDQVASSMKRAYGAPRLIALHEWHQRVAGFLGSIDGLPVHVVDHGRLVGSTEASCSEVARLIDLLDSPAEDPTTIAGQILDPKLSRSATDQKSIPARTRELWQRLEALHPDNLEHSAAPTADGC